MRVSMKSVAYRTRSGVFAPPGSIVEVEDDEGVALIKSGFAQAFQGALPQQKDDGVNPDHKALRYQAIQGGVENVDNNFMPVASPQPLLKNQVYKGDE